MCEILMVDDSEIVAESVSRWLKRAGYRVVVARNCAEARALAAGHEFAVHIVDFALEDGHGIDLAIWLKYQGHSAETIFYTGQASGSETLDLARRFGRVVIKGESVQVLLDAVRELIGSHPAELQSAVCNGSPVLQQPSKCTADGATAPSSDMSHAGESATCSVGSHSEPPQ